MPLIEFPDVPFATGVPNVKRAVIGVAQRVGLGGIQKYDLFGLFDQVTGNLWQILDKGDKPLIVPDTVLSFEYQGSAQSAMHPVSMLPQNKADKDAGKEHARVGSFYGYNKALEPFELTIRFAVTGGSVAHIVPTKLENIFKETRTNREAALKKLEEAKASTRLFKIVTPDQVYEDCSLESVDYTRNNESGVSMLILECKFLQIRAGTVVAKEYTQAPSAAKTQNNGSAPTEDPLGAIKAKVDQVNNAAKALFGDMAASVEEMAGGVVKKAKEVANDVLQGTKTFFSGVS